MGDIVRVRKALYACEMKRQKKVAREDGYGGKTEVREVSQVVGKGGDGCEKGEVEKVGSKGGRPARTVPTELQKKAVRAAELGIPDERIAILCGFYDGGGAWGAYLTRNPDFGNELKQARVRGEVDMASVVQGAGNGWQGSAWILERTRGYVARQQLEHSGPGGKALTIAHQVLAAVQHGERA